MQEGHCLGSQVRQFCHSKGFQPEISCRSAQIDTVLAMVEAGLGISLIPKMALPRRQKIESFAAPSMVPGLDARLLSLGPGKEN
jgi:LysR family hydrogen peroxide-inducible transcriptional activator